MSFGPWPRSDVYTNIIAWPPIRWGTRWRRGFGWTCWPQRFQKNPYIICRTSSNPNVNWHIKVRKLSLKGLLRSVVLTWSWPCSWHFTNNSRASLVAFCRSLSVYLPGGPRLRVEAFRAWAGTGVESPETAGDRKKIPLPLIRAPPASFFLPTRGSCGESVSRPSDWLAGLTPKIIFVLLNGLANLFDLELLEL